MRRCETGGAMGSGATCADGKKEGLVGCHIQLSLAQPRPRRACRVGRVGAWLLASPCELRKEEEEEV